MKFFRRFLIALLLLELASVFSPEAFAETGTNVIPTEAINAPRIAKTRTDKDKPLPETEVVKVKGKVEDLFGKFFFSQQIPTKSEQFQVGVDPVLAEIEVMDRLIDRVKAGEIPPAEAHIVLTRYHLGDDRVFARLKKAADAGMFVDVITDLNDSVIVDGWKEKEMSLLDFSDKRVKPNDTPNGKMYEKLLKAGFEPGTGKKKPRLGIYSQEVFNKKAHQEAVGEDGLVMFDIMHEKSVVAAWVKKGKIVEAESSAGSANMVSHGVAAKLTGDKDIITRVNIVREIKSPELNQKRYEHAMNLRDTLSKTGKIADLPTEKFLRINTENGFVETGFTDGKYNLNDRIAAMVLLGVPGMTQELVAKGFDKGVESYYERMSKEFKGLKIKEIRESQFVYTHSQGREAEKLLFDGDPDVIKKGIYDAKFSSVTGWGFPPVQSTGVPLLRRLGGTIFPWKKALADRVDSQVYLRRLPGVAETDMDGPPLARFLLHTKLWMMKGELPDGREVTVIFDGSLNRSNHKENAEDQDMIVIFGKSDLAEAYWTLPEELKKAEAEHFSTAALALMTDTFARFTGKSPIEVPHEFSTKVSTLISLGEIDKAATELEKLAKVKTELESPPTPREIQGRIDKFRTFLHWHKKNFPWSYGKTENYYLNQLMAVATIMFDDKVPDSQAAYALKGIMWSRDATDQSQIDLAKEAWKIIGRTGEFPAMKVSDGSDVVGTKDNRGTDTNPELGEHRENQRSARAAPPKPKVADPEVAASEGAGATAVDCNTAAKGVSGKKAATPKKPRRTSDLGWRTTRAA